MPEGESLLGASKKQLQELVSLLPKTLVHLGLGIREMDDDAWKVILERFENLERLDLVLGNPGSSSAMTNQVWYWLAAYGRRLMHLDVRGVTYRLPAYGTRMWTPEAILELAKLPNMRHFAIVLDRIVTGGSTIRLADLEALCTAWRDLEHLQFNIRKPRGGDMSGFLAKLARPSLGFVDLGCNPQILTDQGTCMPCVSLTIVSLFALPTRRRRQLHHNLSSSSAIALLVLLGNSTIGRDVDQAALVPISSSCSLLLSRSACHQAMVDSIARRPPASDPRTSRDGASLGRPFGCPATWCQGTRLPWPPGLVAYRSSLDPRSGSRCLPAGA